MEEESPLLDLSHSHTQRIVLLVDLHHPLQDPSSSSSYISSVVATARAILSFPPLSSSLFAFKLFFSSLSPLLSTSNVHRLLGKSAAFISFDRPSQTLISLSSALNSIPSLSHAHHSSHLLPLPHPSHPSASLTAQSLLQLAHDYTWEPHIPDPKGTLFFDIVTPLPSNLVVLFSPLPRSVKRLSEFMDVNAETEESCSANVEMLKDRFFRVFGAVREGFAARDIHFSWVNVNFDPESKEGRFGVAGAEQALGFLGSGIKGLGWGFCSTDAIVLGSKLVPFGLIYQNIGCLIGSKITDGCKVGHAELSLEISDVNGQPLECKCCDLELFDRKSSSGRSTDLSRILDSADLTMKDSVRGKAFWRNRGNGITKIHVKEVRRANGKGINMRGKACEFVFLRGFSGKCARDQKRETSGDFFADKVLEMLQTEVTEFKVGKPAWQLLLSFLYKESYLALASVSSGNGNPLMGILQPLTVHSAILCIVYNKHDFDSISSCWYEAVNKKDNGTFDAKDDLSCVNVFSSQSSSSSYSFDSGVVEGKGKRNKKRSIMLQDLTWSSFRKKFFSQSCEDTVDYIGPEMELEALYFSKHSDNSKKLRFLKCWMKQIKRCGWQITANDPKIQNDAKEVERNVSSQQESELPVCSSLVVGEASLSGPIKYDDPTAPCIETLEAFSESISQKIQRSLNSEEVDLGLLAERILNSSIQWLSVKFGGNASENLTFIENGDAYPAMVPSEVEKLLLRKPRDLVAKYKGCGPATLKSSTSFCVNSSEQKLREHELQILFRMEILKSKIAASIEEPAKQKMIKEICSLLENIEFNLQGGLFGGESLVEFAERTIKTRYACSLAEVIQRIYTQMEFFSFDDDDDEPSSLPNSDSHGEQRAKQEIEIVKNVGGQPVSGQPVRKFSDMNSLSTDDEPPCQVDDSLKCRQMCREMVHEIKLKEAQERRERARRFASFTSWVPDLQRVWAPKQPKAVRSKSESHQKALGRKRRGDRKEVVCETPLVGIKRTCARGNDGACKRTGSSCGSVSKALFHRDGDATASAG